jgi:hypothetical protein
MRKPPLAPQAHAPLAGVLMGREPCWLGVGGILAPGRQRGATMISHRLTVLFDLERVDRASILWIIDTVPLPPYTRATGS